MFNYKVKLNGSGAERDGISSFVLRDLMDVLTEGILRALRLRIEGRSAVAGIIPAWLDVAANVDVYVKDASTIEIEAPPLHETMPERFKQLSFFAELDTSKSCFAVFEESLNDALRGDANSDLYDNGVLETFAEFKRLLARGVESVEINNGRPRPSGPIVIQSGSIDGINRLRRQTPASRRVRLAAKIDMIRHSDRMFTLILESGEVLRGVASGIEEETLKRFFGKVAVVSGEAVFRPSGSLLRIEADHIEAASGDVSIWSVAPRPLEATIDTQSLSRHQGPLSGLNAIFGRWPGDETDEEIFSALEAIS